MIRFAATMAVILLLGTSAIACQNDDNGPDDESPSAETILSEARAEWDETESAHFTLDVDGEAFLDSERTIRLRSAEGDILRPDSVSASASITVSVLTVDVSLIAVGGDMYMTNFVSGRWESAPEDFSYDPSILFSDTTGIGPVMAALENVTLDGEESVDSTDTRKVSGTADADSVSAITAGAVQGDEIAVTLWIGADTNRIYRVTLTEPAGVSDEPATWTLNLSDHNDPVTVEPPPV